MKAYKMVKSEYVTQLMRCENSFLVTIEQLLISHKASLYLLRKEPVIWCVKL